MSLDEMTVSSNREYRGDAGNGGKSDEERTSELVVEIGHVHEGAAPPTSSPAEMDVIDIASFSDEGSSELSDGGGGPTRCEDDNIAAKGKLSKAS